MVAPSEAEARDRIHREHGANRYFYTYMREVLSRVGILSVLKPDPAIYRHVLDDLGISAAEAVFIDDREPNVRGAESVGITGHLFTGVVPLRAFLAALPAAAGQRGSDL